VGAAAGARYSAIPGLGRRRELLTFMLADPATIEPALDLILLSRHLERIGDHATNIAEDVIFMVSAKDVRHYAAEGGAVWACGAGG
jgi:hypothetical protein